MGFLVTEGLVNQFRKLMVVVFGAGALAGLVLFAVQYFTVVPLIQAAETYEAAGNEAHSGTAHENEGWQPAEGWERTSFTVLTTVLTGIGFAAMLFGAMALAGKSINTRQGALWGLAAFACFSLAPALGLPPEPPGVAVADLHQRQIWWAGTVIATAVGVWLIAGQRRSWLHRNLWSSVPVAATPDWRTRGYRTRQCSSGTGPPIHTRISGDQRHILAAGRHAWRLNL
jgi:cobalt transporter subunit CbtA